MPRARTLVPIGLAAVLLLRGAPARADDVAETYNAHGQITIIAQGYRAFRARRTGSGDGPTDEGRQSSISANLFLGMRLWQGLELYVGPETEERSSLRQPYGVAAFPNLELFHAADPYWQGEILPFFLRQTVELGGAREIVASGPFQLAGPRDARRLVLALGRFSLYDSFDTNRFARDAGADFLNSAIAHAGAFDAPADILGYTWGASAELSVGRVSLRAAAVMLPAAARSKDFDTNFGRAHGYVAEAETHYGQGAWRGAVRYLVFVNEGKMGDYARASQSARPDLDATRAYGRRKVGFVLGVEQALGEGVGLFARLGANDGRHETLSFVEVDRSASVGVVLGGGSWRRPYDEAGVAAVASAVSPEHQLFLARGGVGSQVGSGRLRYGAEGVIEGFYRLALSEGVALTADYQLVVDPGYDRARGPIHFIGGRAHAAF